MNDVEELAVPKSPGQLAHEYLQRLQEFVKNDYAEWCGRARAQYSDNYPRLHLVVGKRFAKIVETKSSGGQQGVFGFIEISSGDIYKAASWNSPAKNFTRGNINDDKQGLGRVKWTGVF